MRRSITETLSSKALLPLMMVLLCVLGTTNAWAHGKHYGKITATTKGNGTVYISTSNTSKTGGAESAATADASKDVTWNCGESSSNDEKTYYIWATGNAGYYLSGWSGANKSTDNPVTAKLKAEGSESNPTSATYTATFAPIPVEAGSADNYDPTALSLYSSKNITFATAKGARLTDFNTPQVGANTGNGAGTFAVNWGTASVDANGLVTIPYSFSATKYGKNTAVITLTTKAGQSNTVTVTANYPDAIFSGATTENMYTDDKETKENVATVSVQYANVTADFNMATFTNIIGGGTWTVTGQNYADGVLTVDYTFFSNGALGTHTADLVFSAKDGSSETLTCTAIVEKQFDADVEVTNAGGTSLTGGLGTDLMSGLALANANAGSTITLMRSVDLGTLAAAPTISKNATLDLNGKVLSGTINATIPYLLYINGSGITVTIKDSKEGGTITATGARNGGLYAVYVNNGNLIQQSGKIAIENTGIYNSTYKSLAAYGVYLKKGSGRSFVMNGGTIESVSGRNAFGVRAEDSAGPATITINGGEITATAPCTSYGIYSSGLVTVHGGTIKGVTDDVNGVAGTTTAYGIYMYAGSSADNSSCYHGTLNMDGGTVKANSKTKTAAAVYIYGSVTATTTAGAGADGTNSNKASAQAFITGGTIDAYAGTTDAYGVQVLGNTNSNNLTQTYPTYISNTTITASATGTAYGVYVWADAADKHGGCRQGEVVLDNNNVEATTRTGTIAYGVYVFAKQITITSTAAGYFPGEYATAGKCMINSGTYRGIAKTETGAGVVTADRVVTTGANKIEAYPQLAIVDGTFYGEAQTQKGRAIISGGQTAINGGTFTATAPTNAIALYVSQGITAVKDGTYNATSTTTTTAYGAYQNAGKSLIYGGTYTGTATTTTAAGIKFNAGDGEITDGNFLGQTAYEPASDGDVTACGLWVVAAASVINASGATFRANLTGASHNRKAYAVQNAGLLTLNGCTLTANSNYQYTYGVYTTNDATVRDCNITLTSTKAYDYGLHINAAGKTLTAINNTVSVTTGTTYGYGGYAQNGTLNLEGGSISVQGSQTGASAEADCVLRGVEIASGKAANITGTTITVRSTNSTYSKTAYGVLNAGTATLTDAKVTVSGIKTGAYGVYNNTNGKTLIESGKYSASASSTSIDVYDKVGNQALNIESGFFVHDNNLKSCIKGTALVFTLESTRDEYKEGYRYEVADQSQTPSVCKIGTTKYKTLEEALQYANANAGGGTIIMTSDYTLPTGHYTIPAKWTLLIPYSDSQNAATTTKPTSSKSGEADPVRFRKLTLSAGTELVVWGALEPSAKMSSNQWGRIDGGYGQIQMEEGSKITVESGATLAAWGYILGKGEVEIKNGGISRELFQLGDWKGGGVTSELLNNSYKVFPVTHYFYQNIAVPVTYRAGARAYGHTGVVAQSTEGRCDDAILVGTSGALLLMDANDASADTWVRKTYIAGKDSLEWFINSGAKLGSINLNVSGYPMNSTNYVLPICPNMYFIFNKGEMDVTQSTAMLPGVRFIINREGALNIPSGVTLYVYDADDYWSFTGSEVTYTERPTSGTWGYKVKYHPTTISRTYNLAALRDADIFVHGELVVSGALQTTSNGANIHSTDADAGKVVFTKSAAADGSVSQCYAGWKVSTLSYRVKYTSHTTTSAQLKNGDGTYVATKGLTVGTTNIHYIYKNNQWNKVEEQGCFSVETDGGGNKTYYAYPSDFVAVAENTNGDHAYHNIEGDDTRYFVWDEDCMWWEATPATDGSTNYLCVDTRNTLNNGKYYTYNSTKGCWEVKYVTAVWKNYDNSALATYVNIPYNTRPRYLSATPKRAPDATYATYYHDGWQINGEGTVYADDELPIATEDNTVYVAHFTGVKAIYTVAFKNADGKVLYSAQYEYGDMPEYHGPAPTKNPTAAKEYEFTGWTPALAAVTGANEYTAQYREVTRKYPITFLDNKGGILEEKMVEYGTTPSYTGLTPYMERDKYYSYTFEGWNKELVAVTGATTYTATFSYTERKYQITFANIDGLGAVHKQDYAADATPVFDGGTPYRESTAEYSYEFLYWKNAAGTTFLPGDALPTVDADVTYTAYFNETVRKYTLAWDLNGGVAGTGTITPAGSVANSTVLQYSVNPTKTGYTFAGWTPTMTSGVTTMPAANTTYVANWTINQYTITFNSNGGSPVASITQDYNTSVTAPANPTKTGYTFAGWSEPVPSTMPAENKTLTANWTINQYDITWKNADGTTLTTTKVNYNVLPTYTGATPTKAATAQYSYTFNGWTPAIVVATENATYTATFASTTNKYTVTWTDENDVVLGTDNLEFGAMPSHAALTKDADAQYTYTWKGWNTEVIAVTGNVTYKSLGFTATPKSYTLTWNLNGGDITTPGTAAGSVAFGTSLTAPVVEKTGYTFNGWNPAVPGTMPAADATYTAQWRANQYTITFDTDGGTEIAPISGNYGDPISAPADPTKDGYTFAGWDKAIPATMPAENKTITANWTINSTYTIIDSEGNEIETAQGVAPEVPSAPSEDYTYTFDGWENTETGEIISNDDMASMAVAGASYRARFTQTGINGTGPVLDIADWIPEEHIVVVNASSFPSSWPYTVTVADVAEDAIYEQKNAVPGHKLRETDRTLRITYAESKNPGEEMMIKIVKNGGEVYSRQGYTVPSVFTEDQTINTRPNGGNKAQIWVKGGTTTINTSFELSKVVVAPDANLIVNSGKTLTISDKLVLRTTAWAAAALDNQGTIDGNVYYSRVVKDNKQYYQFAIPFSCAISAVTLSDGASLSYGRGWTLKRYDEESRSNNGSAVSNWVELLESESISPAAGYEMFSGANYYREYLFPVTLSSSTTTTISYHLGSAGAQHAGWNAVCSPLTKEFRQVFANPSKAVKVSELMEDGRYYQHIPTTIRPAVPFYYQASQDQTQLVFGSEMTASAPYRAIDNEEVATEWLQVNYSDAQGHSDETNIFLHPTDFVLDYENGLDVAKLSTAGARPFLYITLACGDLAFAALPDEAAQRIPLTVYSPADGEYTFSLTDNDYMGRMDAVYLVDEQTGIYTDLLSGDTYSVAVEQGTTTGRFYLMAEFAPAPGVTTGMDNTESAENIAVEKVLINGLFYIRRGGELYDWNGRQVK